MDAARSGLMKQALGQTLMSDRDGKATLTFLADSTTNMVSWKFLLFSTNAIQFAPASRGLILALFSRVFTRNCFAS
jgi:hypothetical protein